MSRSHSINTNSSFNIDPLVELAQTVKKVKLEAINGTNYSDLEDEVSRLFSKAQREVLGALIEIYDVDLPSFEYQGLTYKKATRNSQRYMTAAGEVMIKRSLYRSERNGQTYCPMELRSGMIEGFWTPKAAKQAIHMVSLVTPAEAHRLFEELGGMSPSRSSLTRLPAKLNSIIEQRPQELLNDLNEQLIVPETASTVSVSLDGVMIATREQVIPGDSKWGEASCGTISFSDAEGEVLSTQYFARMPERLKHSLKTQLTTTMEAILEQRPDLSIVKVADGARDNWKFLEGQFKHGDNVLDYYHASQHLHEAMEFIFGVNSKEVSKWHKKYRRILRDDPNGITKVIRHLNYRSKKKVKNAKGLAREITYFQNNKHRCDYARLRAENKPIGSGIVESACKTVVQIRCKRAGQRWEHDGGQAILRFRSLLLSNQLDTAWEYVKSHYQNDEIKLPNNVVMLRQI